MNNEFVVTRKHLMEILRDAMSDASEDAWSASWYSGLEELLPDVCRKMTGKRKTTSYRTIYIDPTSATLMCEIADVLGHWVDMHGNAYVPACDKKNGKYHEEQDETNGQT